jgi:hypothetical protein
VPVLDLSAPFFFGRALNARVLTWDNPHAPNRCSLACLPVPAEVAEQATDAPAAVAPPSLPRMYFWLRGRDLAQAMQGLGRLKSYLRQPPTLAKRAGVPQKKLSEIGSWCVRQGCRWLVIQM